MSAHVATPAAPLERDSDEPRSLRLPRIAEQVVRSGRRELVIALLALPAAAASAALVLTAGVVERPGALATTLAVSELEFAFVGAVWWRLRPWSPFGPMLLAFGAMHVLWALQGSSDPLLFSLGLLVDIPGVVLLWYLLLTFPSGRLRRGDKIFFAGVGLVAAALLVRILLSDHVSSASALAQCAAACPQNVLQAADVPALRDAAWAVFTAGRLTLAVALSAILVSRYLRASAARRRLVAPVYAISGIWLLSWIAYGAAADAGDVSDRLENAIGWVVAGTRLALPLGFFVAVVLARAYAGSALQNMLAKLRGNATATDVERLVRHVLGDPTASLAFWLPRGNRFVDLEGRRVTRPPPGGRWSWNIFPRTGEPELAVKADAVFDDDHELIDAAGAGALLALENRRLQLKLHQKIEELRASRSRLATVGAAERRRIERNLHDGAQQRLIALRIELDLAAVRSAGDDSTRTLLCELGDQVDETLEELRMIAQGIYPPLLAEEGLAEALRQAARRAAISVDLETDGIGRYTEDVESEVYFCCIEALQNAAKHGGADANVHIRVLERGTELIFAVQDDGPGFVVSRGVGGGLVNMEDRIGAVGGELRILSSPGRGTVVEGVVPVPSRT